MAFGRVGLFISTNQLRERLSTVWRHNKLGSDLRVLDSSYDFDEENDGYKDFYQKGHIESAVYFNPVQCSQKTPNIPFDLPDINCFTDYVQSLGISPETNIVTYDRLATRAALRTWWMFRLFGHRKISVLDGGLKKWVRDGYPITTAEPEVERGTFEAKLDPTLMKTYKDVKNSVNSKTDEIIDGRGSAAFNKVIQTETGEEFMNHIPGSKNIPYTSLFNEDGTFKSKEDLLQVFKEGNIDMNKPWIGSCMRGILACGILAAAETVGKQDTPNYYGSYTDWSKRMVTKNS